MKLSDFTLAETLVAEHRRLLGHAAIATSGNLGVTVRGTYQPDAIVAMARAPIAAEFMRQAAEVEAALAMIGVTVDTAQSIET